MARQVRGEKSSGGNLNAVACAAVTVRELEGLTSACAAATHRFSCFSRASTAIYLVSNSSVPVRRPYLEMLIRPLRKILL